MIKKDSLKTRIKNWEPCAIANRFFNITLSTLILVISVSYLIEAIKGNSSMITAIIATALGMTTIIISWVMYSKNNKSTIIKHIGSIGFLVFYTILLFESKNDMAFAYAFPFIISTFLFNDSKFTLFNGIVITIINIANATFKFFSKEATPELIIAIKIQILLTIVVVIFSLIISFVNARLNENKIDEINSQKESADNLVKKIISTSKSMVNNISDVTNKIIDLDTAIVNNVDAMNEVNNGTCESANAIQNQLLKTKQIQNNIDEVKDASITIQNDVNKAVSDINNGQELITLLKRVTHHCEDDGKLVADELNRFKEYTNKINSIIDLITNVATQTSLLSLNASIEAARAGEAGKGFAVVATEISDLANQTTSATDDITSLINNISNELQIMIDTIDKLLEGNKAQIKHVEETSLSFTKITSNINTIQEKSKDLINVVKSLEISNTAIIESIQTVSSITEEVAAHSNETLNSSEQNKDVVSNIKSIIEDLNESANNLNNI